ncbi:MAG: cyclase family protein, partial [Dehalococcoidales bacterium]|nr:cyclase family protein [Dehalococcoidales bacterium]
METNQAGSIGNWGKWGDKDERGAVNFVTPEVLKSALTSVKKGKVYSLSIPVQLTGVPRASFGGRRTGCVHLMTLDGGDFAAGTKRAGVDGVETADDYIFLATHGTTHIDALCHCWIGDKLYNGFSGNTVRSNGARYCGIDKVKWLVARGILLDIAGYKGVNILDRGYAITAADLDACAAEQGVSLRSGDVLLVRTGWINAYEADPEHWDTGPRPGLGIDTLPWIINKEICAVGADNTGVEVAPP